MVRTCWSVCMDKNSYSQECFETTAGTGLGGDDCTPRPLCRSLLFWYQTQER